MKIAYKVLLLLNTSIAISLTATTAFELRSLKAKFERENDQLHQTILANVISNLAGALFNVDDARVSKQISSAFEFGSLRRLTVIDDKGRVSSSYQSAKNEVGKKRVPEEIAKENVILPLSVEELRKPARPFQEAASQLISGVTVKGDERTVVATLWYDDSGNQTFVGHAILEYDNDSVEIALQDARRDKVVSALAVAAIILVLTYYFLRFSIIQRLERFEASVIKVKNRDYSSQIEINGKDEIADLAEVFKSMVNEIQSYQKSLESKVKDQTRDIRAMLETTKIGLFSVTKDLLVHKDYAKYLETIVEQSGLKGKNLENFLLGKSTLGPDAVAKIITAIEYSMGEDEIVFEANATNLPKEIEAVFDGQRSKILDLDWSPMYDDDGNVDKILISVRDVTENLALKKEAEEGRRNLQRLGEIIAVGPDKFMKFATEAKDTMGSIRLTLKNVNETIDAHHIKALYALLHTLKGTARLFKFGEATNVIHKLEDSLSKARNTGSMKASTLNEGLLALEAMLSDYAHSFRPLQNLAKNAAINQVSEELSQEHEAEQTLHQVFESLEEMADQLAKDLGKGGCRIDYQIDPKLDVKPALKKVLARSLIHLIRNTVDHGLEKPEERLASGKANGGLIQVFLDKDGYLGIRDDGRGICLSTLEKKARAAGLSIPNNPIDIAYFIFEDGLSTAAEVSDISGRGVGMGAVQSFLQEVGSSIEIVDEGTYKDAEGRLFLRFSFRIRLPEHILATKGTSDLRFAV